MGSTIDVIFGDATLGVAAPGFHALFSYQTGGLESLYAAGREWIYRTVRPTFWRALTDNDRGSRFHLRSGIWLAADAFIRFKDAQVELDGQAIPLPVAPENDRFSGAVRAQRVAVTFHYETVTNPPAAVDVRYEACAEHIRATAHYHGTPGLPQLPAFGLRMIMPTLARGYRYEGLSGETYPDRKAGAERGVFDVSGLPVTPYIMPQECGMHMDTQWVEITRDTALDNRRPQAPASSLRIAAAERPFAFSCLPYTALELENATHHEELPPARRTVLCVYGAVRGVGGINAWGADVEPAYHIDAGKDIEFSFDIVA